MRLFNQTKKTIIVDNVREAKGFLSKSKGLIGTQNPQAIMFQTRWGIHTFGMTYAIDVIILDKQNVVRVIKKTLKPNRMFLWNPKYDTVIELPIGVVKKSTTEKGHKLSFPRKREPVFK